MEVEQYNTADSFPSQWRSYFQISTNANSQTVTGLEIRSSETHHTAKTSSMVALQGMGVADQAHTRFHKAPLVHLGNEGMLNRHQVTDGLLPVALTCIAH